MSEQVILEPKVAVKAPAYAWVILLVVYLASVAAPLNLFKVAPVMPILMQAFHMSLSSAGMLVSIFSITGFFLALPSGFILQRLGLRLSVLIAMGIIVVGSTLGAVSTTVELMLASRFIEGAGMALIMVVAPAAIAVWFPEDVRGLPMGIWGTCCPVGSVIMMNLAPAIALPFGWRAVWWAGAIFSLVAFVLFWALFRLPGKNGGLAKTAPNGIDSGLEEPPSFRKGLANGSLWLLALAFFCLNVVLLGFATYYPTFLNTQRNYTLARAGLLSSTVIFGSFATPLCGYFSDIWGRKRVIVIAFILLGLFYVFPFTATGWGITAAMIYEGLVFDASLPPTFAGVADVMSPQLVGVGMAVLALTQNLGMFVGPVIFGQLASSLGWAAAGYAMIPVCLVGAAAGLLAKIK